MTTKWKNELGINPEKLTPEQSRVRGAAYFNRADVIFWTGAKRSGKTVGSLLALVSLAMKGWVGADAFTPARHNYIIGGVSVGAVKRNMQETLENICEAYDLSLKDMGGADPHWLIGGISRFYYFGGETIRAYRRVRGLTAHSALIDEATLCHEDFISEVNTRLSFPDSLLILATNKDSPNHPLRTRFDGMNDRVLKIESSFWDNPFFSDERREAVIASYPDKNSADYKRDILNEWCPREGVVFPIVQDMLTDDTGGSSRPVIAVDPGVGNTTGALRFDLLNGRWVVTNEYYYHSGALPNLTEEEHMNRIAAKFGIKPGYPIIVDSAASGFKAVADRLGFVPLNAKKDILPGVRATNNALTSGGLQINRACGNLLSELDAYIWAGDKPIKLNDHLCDCLRYGSVEIFGELVEYG